MIVEKERKLLFAGFRKQPCRAYVDGQLVAEHSGSGRLATARTRQGRR